MCFTHHSATQNPVSHVSVGNLPVKQVNRCHEPKFYLRTQKFRQLERKKQWERNNGKGKKNSISSHAEKHFCLRWSRTLETWKQALQKVQFLCNSAGSNVKFGAEVILLAVSRIAQTRRWESLDRCWVDSVNLIFWLSNSRDQVRTFGC